LECDKARDKRTSFAEVQLLSTPKYFCDTIEIWIIPYAYIFDRRNIFMRTEEELLAFDKSKPDAPAAALTAEEIAFLVESLSRKEDDPRYRALLLLQSRSAATPDVYRYWDVFRDKLTSENSYQRSIGMLLLAANARWDEGGRCAEALDDMAKLLGDEKPITIRQCVGALEAIALAVPEVREKICTRLMATDLSMIRETMRKLVQKDIVHALTALKGLYSTPETEAYITRASTANKQGKQTVPIQGGNPCP
jgi:hypothetical protein